MLKKMKVKTDSFKVGDIVISDLKVSYYIILEVKHSLFCCRKYYNVIYTENVSVKGRNSLVKFFADDFGDGYRTIFRWCK